MLLFLMSNQIIIAQPNMLAGDRYDMRAFLNNYVNGKWIAFQKINVLPKGHLERAWWPQC